MADKKISELDAITGSNTAATDVFVVVDTSTGQTKKITREELNNAIEQDVLSSIDIDTINGDFSVNGNINLGDNNKAIFGAGSDLQIYHDGSNSRIVDGGTGNLNLQGTNLVLSSATGSPYLQGVSGGTTAIYFNGSSKLSTTATGIDVTGTVTADGLTVDGDARLQGSQAAPDEAYLLTLRNLSDGGAGINFDNNVTANFAQIIGDVEGTGAGTNDGVIRVRTANNGTLHDSLRIDASGDISFYEDTGTTAKLFWDASAERLGLGTSSPSAKVDVVSIITTSKTNLVRLNGNYTAGNLSHGIGFSINGNPASAGVYVTEANGFGSNLVFTTSPDFDAVTPTNTERMRISSAGDVLISTTSNIVANSSTSSGTSIGSGLLESARAGVVAQFNRQTSDGSVIDIQKSGTTVGSIGVVGGDNLYIAGNSSHAGGLGIGTSSIYPVTSTGASDNGTNDLGNTSAYFRRLYISGGIWSPAGSLPLHIGGTERARLDASGNLLVGTTDANNVSDGVRLKPDGFISVANTSGPVLYANRLSTDGSILAFQKDGATVGSIGTNGGDLTIGTGDVGLKFNDSAGLISAWDMTANAPEDGNFDLGYASGRFKDLHLSGTAYAGGLTVNGASKVYSGFINNSITHSVTSTSSYAQTIILDDFGLSFDNNSNSRGYRFSNNGNERMRLTSGGNVGIGNSAPSEVLDIKSTSSAPTIRIHAATNSSAAPAIELQRGTNDTWGADIYTDFRIESSEGHIKFFGAASGTTSEYMRLENDKDLHVDGNVVAYSTTISDIRLKKDIAPIEDAVTKVQQLNGCTFTYLKDDRKSAGLIAQDVEKVLPSAVIEDEAVFHGEEGETYKTVQYDQLIGLLVEAVKELKAEIEELKNGTAK